MIIRGREEQWQQFWSQHSVTIILADGINERRANVTESHTQIGRKLK